MGLEINLKVKPDTLTLVELLDETARGKVQVPVFQRDFIWETSNIIKLFDSIINGYPIGSLLFWSPDGSEYKIKDKIGPYKLAVNQELSPVQYVLDGYQRISTLFGVLSDNENFEIGDQADYRKCQVYYDLLDEELTSLKPNKDKSHVVLLSHLSDPVKLVDVLQTLSAAYEKDLYLKLAKKAKELNRIFIEYRIPFVKIVGGDIRSAVEIFSRVNSQGVEISSSFMLSALTYDEHSDFLFEDELTEFVNNQSKFNFSSIRKDILLNCIASAYGEKGYFDVKLETLYTNIDKFKQVVKKSFIHIQKAIEFLYKEVHILNSTLLPYPAQLIFISEYFRVNETPTIENREQLKKWFWFTSYSNYFTIYKLSQQRVAYQVFIDFAQGKHDSGIYKMYKDFRFVTAEFPKKMDQRSVRSKTLRLFYINRLFGSVQPDDYEQIIEKYITSKKDKSPANVLLFPITLYPDAKREIENRKLKNDCAKHFLKDEDFDNLSALSDGVERESFIKQEEKQFVESLEIEYISGDTIFDNFGSYYD